MDDHRRRAAVSDDFKANAGRSLKGEVDGVDLAILEALQENGRLPLSELARQIGMSQPSVSERVKRLEERGVITGYGARIDPTRLGPDRKSTRLNSSHVVISYAVFCLKKNTTR